MGMDNVPRPSGMDVEQADLSGWMALFADDMVNISTALGETDRAEYYMEQYNLIGAAINAQLWDETTDFYYDRNAGGLLLEKSYTGLIPFIAGVSSPAQTEAIMASLTDPEQFWSSYGIRSMPADSALFESGYSASGWKNSNWRGPVWIPINYLLVQRVEQVDPAVGDQLRENLIANVESNWQASGRFYEYYDGDTGAGLGADHQTGWTALVANLIYEKYHK
jgi:mannosyl-oligosaccharide glucosidase